MLSDILLPYQRNLVKRKPTERLIVRKSRRTGYTWSQSARMVFDCMENQPWYVISYRLESSKLVIEDCVFWVNKLIELGLTKNSDWELLKESVTYKPTSKSVRALPCVPAVIRGKKGNVFIDEAAHIPQLKEILDAVRPLTIWGYGITMVSSPYLPGLFEELCKSDRWECVEIDIYTAVEQGLYHKIREEIGEPEPTNEECDQWIEGLLEDAGKSADHEYLCKTISDNSGDWISAETQMINLPVILDSAETPRYTLQVKESHVMGIDVGVADNPTFISIVGKSGIVQLIELRNRTIPQLSRYISALINLHTKKVVIDTNGIGRGLADTLAEKHKQLVIYQPNTSQWINSECVKFLSGVWSGEFPISSDPIVISDLSSVEMLDGKLIMRQRTIDGCKRHCDSVPSMALAYQYWGDVRLDSMYL